APACNRQPPEAVHPSSLHFHRASDVPDCPGRRAGTARSSEPIAGRAVERDTSPATRASGAQNLRPSAIRSDRRTIRLGIICEIMEPKLAAVAGPRQGTVISLEAARTGVGRDAANELCLQSMWVSRRHCVIERQGAGLTIADLGSHNGTFVNGVPVKERALLHGDQVRIGDSIFLVLLLDGEPAPPGAAVELKDQVMVTGATIELSQAASLQIAAGSPAPAGRAERDLSVLLRISAAIGSIRGVDALQRAILESLFEVVPAERCVLLLAGKESGEITST